MIYFLEALNLLVLKMLNVVQILNLFFVMLICRIYWVIFLTEIIAVNDLLWVLLTERISNR